MIEGDICILYGDVIIVGQMVLGCVGIMIYGYLFMQYGISFGNIVFWYLCVRLFNFDVIWLLNQYDVIQFLMNYMIMFDYIDVLYGVDEMIDFWGGVYDVILQWLVIIFLIYDEVNGWMYNKGIINYCFCEDNNSCQLGDDSGGCILIYYNFFVYVCNCMLVLLIGLVDVINNVVYNGCEGFVYYNFVRGDFNIVGNVYFEGLNIVLVLLWFVFENGMDEVLMCYYIWDNWVEDLGCFVGCFDNLYMMLGFGDVYIFVCCGIEVSQVNVVGFFDWSSDLGYELVMVYVGDDIVDIVFVIVGVLFCDIVNEWVVDDLQQCGGVWGNCCFISWMQGFELQIMLLVNDGDGDNDGMNDVWEFVCGFDLFDLNDYMMVMLLGYIVIEEYINGFVDVLLGEGIFVDDFEMGMMVSWLMF